MSRSIPWRVSCLPSIKEKLESLSSYQLLLVKRIGPTSFLISASEGREKFRTSIGDPHHCSCAQGTELCVHILFILCKVFYIPKENPLVWQRALVAAEIDELLKSETRVRLAQRRDVNSETAEVPNREIEPGDVCPICFEEFDDNVPLSYCQGGCGKFVHTSCFKQYMRHNTLGSLRCPFCRNLWIQSASNTSKKCKGCSKYINGQCYSCLFCSDYFLCAKCFHNGGTHLNHPFSLLGVGGVADRRNERRVSVNEVNHEPAVQISAEVLPLMYRDLDPDDYEALLQLDEQNVRRVLTEDQFMSLKRGNWSSSLLTDTCQICLETFETSSVCLWLACGHFFHVYCAKTWLTRHTAECPVDHSAVIVPIVSGTPENESAVLPSLIVGRRPYRQQRGLTVPSTDRRIAFGRRATTRPTKREINVSNGGSLPIIGIQVVSLGILPRREQHLERFRYGSTV